MASALYLHVRLLTPYGGKDATLLCLLMFVACGLSALVFRFDFVGVICYCCCNSKSFPPMFSSLLYQ